jgi:hypothetical protein
MCLLKLVSMSLMLGVVMAFSLAGTAQNNNGKARPQTSIVGYIRDRMCELREEKEIARLQCSVEPITKSVRNTKVILGGTSAGKSIQEIQIAGESEAHSLAADARSLRG